MELSIFLAKVIGWYFVIVSLFVFLNQGAIKEMIIDLSQQKTARIIIALITLIIGLLLILSHNIWVLSWPLLITLISWLIFIGGIIRLFAFDAALKMGKKLFASPLRVRVIMAVYCFIGLFLLFKAYAASYSF